MNFLRKLEGGQMLRRHFPQIETDACPVSVPVDHAEGDRMHLRVGKIRKSQVATRRNHAVVFDFNLGFFLTH